MSFNRVAVSIHEWADSFPSDERSKPEIEVTASEAVCLKEHRGNAWQKKKSKKKKQNRQDFTPESHPTTPGVDIMSSGRVSGSAKGVWWFSTFLTTPHTHVNMIAFIN